MGSEQGLISCQFTAMARDHQKSQHKRSLAQRAQTCWMHGFRHNHPSPNEIQTTQDLSSSFDTHNNRTLMRKVAEEKKSHSNSERREIRVKARFQELKEKFGERDENLEELKMAVTTVSDEKEALQGKAEELAERNVELRQELKNLTARLNSRVRREPKKIQTAVRQALLSMSGTEQIITAVKMLDGTIQNWARNVILHLVCASDVPAAKTWTAFSAVVEGLGIPIEGSWSARSAGRVVLEGALAAQEMIVDEFSNILGRHSVCKLV